MSEVEELWIKLAKAFGDSRKWSELNMQQQAVFIDGVNRILAVLHRMV